jgi:hypothetical protein
MAPARTVLALVAALVPVASGCGSSSEAASSSTSGGGAGAGGTTSHSSASSGGGGASSTSGGGGSSSSAGGGGGGGAAPIPASFFGLQSKPTNGTYPDAVKFGSYRLWDEPIDWAALNPGDGQYDWQPLDTILGILKSKQFTGPLIYTFGVVPKWASSMGNDDTGCDFQAPGGCHLPGDLQPNGSGTDAHFKDFVRALALHVNDATYLQTHAHITHWEPWNEWYRNPMLGTAYDHCLTGHGCSIVATYAQMVRLAEDVRCSVTGSGAVSGAACIETPADAAARILAPSTLAKDDFGAALAENFLHCDDTPYPNSICNTGDRGRQAIDILNFHIYTYNTESAEDVILQTANLRAPLSPADRSLPIWSDEGGWGTKTDLVDPDMQSAFVARYYLVGWSVGLPLMMWYEFENQGWGTLCNPAQHCTLNQAGVAYRQIYTWMVGNVMSTPCAASGAVYTCPLVQPDGTKTLAVWSTDPAVTCANGTCPKTDYSYDSTYTKYFALASGTSVALGGPTVKIGAKPILLSQ